MSDQPIQQALEMGKAGSTPADAATCLGLTFASDANLCVPFTALQDELLRHSKANKSN